MNRRAKVTAAPELTRAVLCTPPWHASDFGIDKVISQRYSKVRKRTSNPLGWKTQRPICSVREQESGAGEQAFSSEREAQSICRCTHLETRLMGSPAGIAYDTHKEPCKRIRRHAGVW